MSAAGPPTVEMALLRREVARLQALCDQQATHLLRLTEAMWQLRQEALATESQRAQPRAASPRDEVNQSARRSTRTAKRHRLGFLRMRNGVETGPTARQKRS